MSKAVIEIEGLRKCFGTHAALDGLDLRVPAGSVFGLLGRNGAGKTTTIKHLLGLIKADRGSARIFGQSVADPGAGVPIRRRIGFVTEDKDLYPYMTVDCLIRFTRPVLPRLANQSGAALSGLVRAAPRQANFGAIKGYALQADAAAGNLARRRTADSR